MGNTQGNKFKGDGKEEKRGYIIRAKIRDLNSLTFNEKFRSKTGYLINFSYKDKPIDKILNMLSTDTLIRAEVVNK